MEIQEINIGEFIKSTAKAKGITNTHLAKLIGKSRQNVQDMFNRQTIDVKLLFTVSKALEYNFFDYYSKQLGMSTSRNLKDEVKATLTIELKRETKDQVLSLVFGDNNLEILKK